MKKNFTKVLLAAAAMTTIGLSYAATSAIAALAEDENGEEPAEMVISPAFVSGEEEIAVNNHSAVVVPNASALAVNFENGPEVKYATYAIDMIDGEAYESLASGALSINTIGYVAFEQELTFVTGKQYQLVVKAWDVAEIWNDWTMVDPIKVDTFLFNGGTGMGLIGEPVWGIDRFTLPEDMINLGVKVSFPSLVLPYGIAAEECEITVSASLYGVPQGNEPMPLSDDDDNVGDDNMGVDGPVALAEAVVFNANVEGGIVSAMLFPEMLEVGNHYAIALNAVTVMEGEEIVAELPEDAYYAVEFDVIPVAADVTLGEPVFGVEEGVVTEDQINLGVQVCFPDAVLGEVNPMNVNLAVSAMLYGVLPEGSEGGIMPLSADDEDIDPGFTNPLIPLFEEPVVFNGGVEGGVLNAYLFPEELAVGNEYVLVLTGVQVLDGENVVVEMPEDATWMTQFVVAELPEPAEVNPEFICGNDTVAINNHAAVALEGAEALVVKFSNAPGVRYATYAIDRVIDEEASVSVVSGELSLNQVGYVEFENALKFVAGQQYTLTVKAWNTTEVVDSAMNVVEPAICEVYTFNGAANTGIIGEPVFGIERGEFPEDMINLGVPVRFPDMILPFGVQAEDCEIVVSASLYGVPEGNEPMPINEDDDVDPGFGGVDGPVVLAEAVLHNASVVGGVVTAYLFAEQMEVGNHYAIDLQAVTVLDTEGEIVAELPEDAYYATDFVVTPYVAPIELGQISWIGIDDENNVDVEEANINGVIASFPFANLGTEDATISIFATLYDITNMGATEDDDVDNMGVQGPVAVAQQLFEGVFDVETGMYKVALFPEVMEVAHTYVISIETMTAELDGEVLYQWDNVEEELFVQFDVVGELPMEVAPELINGMESIALNGHAAVSVEQAEALAVNFINAAGLRYATYAIDRVVDEENVVAMASGELSLNRVGYVAFEQPLVFVSGHQYTLTIKGWNTTEIVDEELNVVEPVLCEVYTINGASATGVIGEPEFGLGLGEEFAEDMINIGLPVRFPDMVLPFGSELEDCEITVSATLVGIPEGNEPMPLDLDEDDNMGVDGPVVLAEAVLHYANVEGGIATAYLFPEVMESGNHYAIILNAVTVMNGEEIVAELPEDAYYAIDFVVGEYVDPTSINAIATENGKVMINLYGQKVNNANGVVILNGEKIMVK